MSPLRTRTPTGLAVVAMGLWGGVGQLAAQSPSRIAAGFSVQAPPDLVAPPVSLVLPAALEVRPLGAIPGASSLRYAASGTRDADSDGQNPPVETEFGKAMLWWSLASLVPWAANELNSGKIPITQTSPRSWLNNIERGFTWDDNEFIYNQFLHTYSGALYFNSFRNHGYPFWAGGLRFYRSATFYTALGAFVWECCGEAHLMSTNDIIATTMGGVAFGEMAYRTSGWILSDGATGFDRFFRELAAGVLNPPRGLNRLLGGRTPGEGGAPGEKPSDQDPVGRTDFIASVGAQHAMGTERGDPAHTGAFVELGWRWGSFTDPFLAEQKPFDLFSVVADINLGGGGPLVERAQVQGNLYSWDIQGGTAVRPLRHKLFVVHNLDYFENQSFRYGAQSLGLAAFSIWDWFGLQWHSQVDAHLSPLAALDSEYAYKTPIKGPVERIREYDFMLGPGSRVKLTLAYPRSSGSHRRILDLSYQFDHFFTQNGSDYDDWDSWHRVHAVRARLRLKEFGSGSWGVDADWFGFFRRSFFTHPEFRRPISEDSHRIRLMLTWEKRNRSDPQRDTITPYFPPAI